MRFKIRNTEVIISFTFFGIFIIFLSVGELKTCLYSFICSVIHELIHIFFIIIFKGKITRLRLSCFGADIVRTDDCLTDNFKEAIICWSAPLGNLLLGALATLISNNISDFTIINAVIGIFNLLPFYSFDGGRGLEFILRMILSEKTVYCILTVLSVMVTVFFSFISVYIFMSRNKNVLLVILSVYMLFSLIFSIKKQKSNYDNNYKG